MKGQFICKGLVTGSLFPATVSACRNIRLMQLVAAAVLTASTDCKLAARDSQQIL